MRHLMIDVETLGLAPGSVLCSIGWAAFDPDLAEPLIESGVIQIDPQSCLDEGLGVDWSTLAWWMEQPKRARQALILPGMPLRAALTALALVVRRLRPERFWAKPAAFDFGVLRAAHAAVGMEEPWAHRETRCLKTLAEAMPVEKEFEPEVPHDPEHDACAQAASAAIRLYRISVKLA